MEIVLYLIGFCALLFLTYVTTRYIGQKQNKAMKSKNISVLETVMLGTDKRLHLVKAGNSYVLIATTSKSVEFLTVVEMDEAAPAEAADNGNTNRFDFSSILEKYSGMYRKRKEKAAEDNVYSTAEKQERPAFRNNLDKLRTIVNGSQNIKVREDGVDVTNDKKTERY